MSFLPQVTAAARFLQGIVDNLCCFSGYFYVFYPQPAVTSLGPFSPGQHNAILNMLILNSSKTILF